MRIAAILILGISLGITFIYWSFLISWGGKLLRKMREDLARRKDPSKRFEYKTQNRIVWCFRILYCLLMMAILTWHPSDGWKISPSFSWPVSKEFLFSLLGASAFFAYTVFWLLSSLDFAAECGPYLTVFVSENEIFLRQMAEQREDGTAYRKSTVPMSQVKDVCEAALSNKEFYSLKGNYYRETFTDRTSYQTPDYRNPEVPSYDDRKTFGADLELHDGTHIFIGFKGIEKFVEVLKGLLVQNESQAREGV